MKKRKKAGRKEGMEEGMEEGISAVFTFLKISIVNLQTDKIHKVSYVFS